MVHISQAYQPSSGWLGDGKIVYRGKQKPNTPFADNQALKRLQESYKQAQAQRRAAQAVKTNKKGHVTVYDASKKAYVSATPEEAKLINASNNKINTRHQLSQKTQLSPGVIDHNLGLDRTTKSAQESMGVFVKRDVEKALSKKTPLTPSVIDQNLGLGRSAKSAQESAAVFNKTAVDNALAGKTIQPKYGIQEFTDRMLGIGRQGKSAQESMGVFVKHDVEQALSKKTLLSPSVIDHNLGLDRAAKSAKESAAVFAEHGLTQTEKAVGDTTKKKGFLSSIGSGIKNLFTKAKNFLKTPKGKWAIAGAAVIAVGTALWAYVSDRFSDKNKPSPTNGPSKVFMPKLNETDEEQQIQETDESDKAKDDDEKTQTEESENDTTVIAPVPVDETNENDSTDNNEKSEDETTVKDDIYKVVKGDNLWNIAKQDLINNNKDKSGYVPTDKEILDRTEELMKLNNKEYEQPLPEDSRKRRVIIEPDEEIKLK